MEAINDSLKNVARSVELLKSYLELNDADNEVFLRTALDLLEKTVDVLSQAT